MRVRAARTGKGDSEVIEDALRRELGFDLLERVWEKALALEAQQQMGRRKR